MIDHTCTAYCGGDVHADLVYGEAGLSAAVMADTFADFYAVDVVDTAPAPEAPGFADMDRLGIKAVQQALTLSGYLAPADDVRILVFWRERP